jgi:preprotein translocase subunit SecE
VSLDKILLTLSALPVAAAIGGFYYFEDQATWVRVIALLVAAGISGLIALQTAMGKAAWEFRREAIIEVRKVVWPTRKETIQTTMVVLVVVIIMALLLWALDSLLAWAVRFLTG